MGSGNQIIVIKLLCTEVSLSPALHCKTTTFLRVTWSKWGGLGGEGMRCSPNSPGRIREPRAGWVQPQPSQTTLPWQNWINKGLTHLSVGSKRADSVLSSSNCDPCCPHLQKKLWAGSHTTTAEGGKPVCRSAQWTSSYTSAVGG